MNLGLVGWLRMLMVMLRFGLAFYIPAPLFEQVRIAAAENIIHLPVYFMLQMVLRGMPAMMRLGILSNNNLRKFMNQQVAMTLGL